MLFVPALRQPEGETEEEVDVLALTLDDETQYRCAGYIQVEIERFAELLEDDAPARTGTLLKHGSDYGQASEEDEEEDNGLSKTKEKEKGKGKVTEGRKSQKKEGNTFFLVLSVLDSQLTWF